MNEGGYTVLILFASLAILFSFLCSLWESCLLSISPSYAHIQEEKGSAIGRQLAVFKGNIDVPLAAILTLNTIAHTVGAIGVGEQASKIWAESNPMVTGVIVPTVMTLAILILSEIIPKTLGANSWKRFAPFTVYSLSVLVKVLSPLIWLSQLLTRSMRKEAGESVLTRGEFMAMADMGVKEGVFEPAESEIIKSLLRFRSVQVKSVMTPRTVTRTAPASMSIDEFNQAHPQLRFSRIPIHEDDKPDEVTGYVRKESVLREVSEGRGSAPLSSIRRDIIVVIDAYPITDLFNSFLKQREHIALVVDEYGGMCGVVTLEDVIETLLGVEIVDELDSHENMQDLARKNWEERAKRAGLLDEPG
jgi:magnesium and cobalt exporter, CNNM family